jgi:hypothetical protein
MCSRNGRKALCVTQPDVVAAQAHSMFGPEMSGNKESCMKTGLKVRFVVASRTRYSFH